MGYYYEDKRREEPSKVAIATIIVALLVVGYFAVAMTLPRMGQSPKDALTVGTNTPFPPFESRQGDKVVGFDIDLAYAIGEKLNRKVVVKDFSDFSAILPALETDAIDVAISGITITPERSEAANFSAPYYVASQAVLVTKNSKFKDSGNLTAKDFSGAKIGFQELTTSQTWVESNLYGRVDLADNLTFSDLNIALQSLRLGAVDGIIMDKPVAETFAKNFADLKVAGLIETDENYGVAVKKGDPQKILSKIDEVIEEMKKNGEYDKLIQKHFGGERK